MMYSINKDYQKVKKKIFMVKLTIMKLLLMFLSVRM